MSSVSPPKPNAATNAAFYAAQAAAAAASSSVKPLRAGESAPLFRLPNDVGQMVSLLEALASGPVVLSFYRGTWCSFCEDSLREMTRAHAEFISLGATTLAIAPPAEVAGAPQSWPFETLQDVEMKVAKAFGLAFDLPTSLRPMYEARGYRPPKRSKDGEWLVPIPATYLIEPSGTVVLAYVDVDYRKRMPPGQISAALRGLHRTQDRPSSG